MFKIGKDDVVINHYQLMMIINEYEKYDKEECLTFVKKINKQYEETNYMYLKKDMIFINKLEYDDIIIKIKINPLDTSYFNEHLENAKKQDKIISDVLGFVYATKGSFDISDDGFIDIIDSLKDLTESEKEMAKAMFLKDNPTKKR